MQVKASGMTSYPITSNRFIARKGKARILVLLCLWWLMNFDAKAQQSADPNSETVSHQSTFRSVGVKECAACHSAPSPIYDALKVTRFVRLVEAKEWLQDKHAYAYELVRIDLPESEFAKDVRQSNLRSLEIQKRLGWAADDSRFASQCLTCHAGHDPRARDPSDPGSPRNARMGVECESCHGPGSEYLQTHLHQQPSWRRLTPIQKASHGMLEMRSATTAAKVCASCHVGNVAQGRYITHAMYAAGHPMLPPFELQTFLDAMPPHWKTIQEKPLRSASDRDPPASFENQLDYYAAQYDLVGPSELATQSIRDSYERTRKSMIGGLMLSDLSQATLSDLGSEGDNYRWGDFANYDCLGCHQALRVGRQRVAETDRIPGRPFPSRWQSLNHAAVFASSAEAQIDTTSIADVFNAVPFGQRSRWQQVHESHRHILEQRAKILAARERKPMTLADVQGWMHTLQEQRLPYLEDFQLARQTGWFVKVATDELVARGVMAPDQSQPLVDELRARLQLDLQIPQKQSVLTKQPVVLETAGDFDAERCRELINALIRLASERR
jgi:hypothetical protein